MNVSAQIRRPGNKRPHRIVVLPVPRSADVAAELFAGQPVEQIARTLHVSPNTVRTHLKRIFSKCEVQSQAELMHVLSLGPLAP
jgi:DNA-binding NarL/FixJ family response regulator